MAKENEAAPEQPVETVPKAEFDALAARLSEVEAKFAASIEPQDPPAEDGPTVDEQLAANNKRVADLYKLANSAGLDDATETAEKWADQGLSVTEAKAALADRMLANNSLTGDSGKPDDDPYAKFRAEFRDNRKEFAMYGVADEDAYVRSRCRDEGLEVPQAS